MCGEKYYMARLASLWIETLLYGFYSALFAASVYVLIHKRPHRWFLVASIAMYTLCTLLIVLDFVVALRSPNILSNTECSSDGACYECPHTPSQFDEVLFADVVLTTQYVLFGINQLVSDGTLIFRCLVVWQYKKWVAVPSIILLLATIACTFAQGSYQQAIYYLQRDATSAVPPPAFFKYTRLYAHFGLAAAALPLVTNTMITALIASRIWWVSKDFQPAGSSKVGLTYSGIITILIESGVLCPLSIIVYFIVYFRDPVFDAIPQSAMQQFTAIAPTLIIVRIGLGRSIDTSPVSLGSAPVNGMIPPRSSGSRTLTIQFAERDTRALHSAQESLEMSGIDKPDHAKARQSAVVDTLAFSQPREAFLRPDPGRQGGSLVSLSSGSR